MKTIQILMFAAAAFLTACGSNDDGPKSDSSATLPAGTLRVVVNAGPKALGAKGALVVAPYASCPPAGPPVGLAFTRIDRPSFPQAAPITGLKPGTYHVLAYVGAGMQPASGDPQVCSDATATLGDREGAALEIALP